MTPSEWCTQVVLVERCSICSAWSPAQRQESHGRESHGSNHHPHPRPQIARDARHRNVIVSGQRVTGCVQGTGAPA